ncbi:hypothetical protein MMC28_003852 [Mycoblastus sanguinarius]|nr:hypothetical protein [Mycoblastus sanguinarius]
MQRSRPLPFSRDFVDAEDYTESLLSFITSSELFQNLCGGVHILDFYTREPDLYSTVLPQDWREWFQLHDVSDILDLLMKEDLATLESVSVSWDGHVPKSEPKWRQRPNPPKSLVDYVQQIRKHALNRSPFHRDGENDVSFTKENTPLPRHVAVGMKPKKIHEVENFVRHIGDLCADIKSFSPYSITHVVDFGSGQNYLGRALASPPCNKKVVAVESKQHNIDGAKSMDVMAKLAEKEKIMRNKKRHRLGLAEKKDPLSNSERKLDSILCASDHRSPLKAECRSLNVTAKPDGQNGNIEYVETVIQSGDLSHVVARTRHVSESQQGTDASDPQLMVISLHSCGNLVHHGLRSLILNPSVKAVAMVGCCYNLVTERLGPPTYKLPSLRSSNLRLDTTSSACDPHGFPMSECFVSFRHNRGEGIRLNITARMMAVQAPENWTDTDCESFFTRHFYRALLQRIFLDRGVVSKPSEEGDVAGGSPRGWTGPGPALTIGSLRKACYSSFTAYVRGAITKLREDKDRGMEIVRRMESLTDYDIALYLEKYKEKKKELSIIWSLMAFSASVIEATIVVDRWLYLKEQQEVRDCWVEAVFDYKQSPRNLVVVGIKK